MDEQYPIRTEQEVRLERPNFFPYAGGTRWGIFVGDDSERHGMHSPDSAVPRVSVLVPVYNTPEQYLCEAIESILGQTFRDFELLIVNDASTDANVEKVIRRYADPRIRYHVNARNLGISGSRNRLLDLARGEYVAVMDHDDISLPGRFEAEVAYLDAHPEVGVVSCAAEVLNDKAKALSFPSDDADIRLGLFEGCMLVHSASMLRRDVLERHGIRYEEDFSPAEDYALWCRLLPHTRFHNLPEALFRYRYHDANTSVVQKERMDRASLAVRCFLKADNPALHDMYQALAVRTIKVKLFGVIPFLKIVRRGRRCTCSVFGIPLYRSKVDRKLFP